MLVKPILYTFLFSLFFNGAFAFAQDSFQAEEIHPVHQTFLRFLETLSKEREPFYFSACFLGKEDHHYDDTGEEIIYAFLVSQIVTPKMVEEGYVPQEGTIIFESLFLTYLDGLGQGLLSAEIKGDGQYGYYESISGLWTRAYATLLYEELKALPFFRRNRTTWEEIVGQAKNFECNVDYSSDLFPKGKK